ncbi:MAG TPA: DUF3969 family protein [Polyangiaceae bacterium]|nr:DUF3969 family protein [Polyangiaceae bacterium]
MGLLDIMRPEHSLGFEAGSAQDGARLAAVLALGVCTAVRQKAITPRYACEKLFRPSLEQTLRQLGVDSKLCDSIAQALELEDVSNLDPEALERSLDGLVTALTDFLAKEPDVELPERESWLRVDEPSQRFREGTFLDRLQLTWKQLQLNGASGIARVCGVYEITDQHRIPGGKFKIKVLERESDFIALPNVCIRSPDGVPEWSCGLGPSELEALQDAVTRVTSDLSARDEWSDESLEWSDPRDF